jgi:uncharacterized protein (TIGR00730 family)
MATGLIAVYCGSSAGKHADYLRLAESVGRALAASGLGIVYGGGSVGLMGAVADACMHGGGRVHGVITQSLLDKEVGHRGLDQLDVVETMHERKARMIELADGFVALPGGFGTWEELCEVITAAQLGHHAKPIVLVDTRAYWRPFISFVEGAIESGFVPAAHLDLVPVVDSAELMIDRLRNPPAPPEPKWVKPTSY